MVECLLGMNLHCMWSPIQVLIMLNIVVWRLELLKLAHTGVEWLLIPWIGEISSKLLSTRTLVLTVHINTIFIFYINDRGINMSSCW